MKKLTLGIIREWKPCYDPNKYLPEDWSGNALDLLLNNDLPTNDVFWTILREDIIDPGIQRRFAAWCAAEALFLSNQTDKRSWAAVEASIKYSLTEASIEELRLAQSAAWSAVGSAVGSAAWSARSAAQSAAWSAAWSAQSAARSAAGAARSAQRNKLISMLKQESDFTLSDLLNNYPIERI